MKKELSLSDSPQSNLEEEIKLLQNELQQVEDKINAFEAVLRSELINEIIEVQELTVLYKKQKKEKKNKRIEQKKRGKNYKEPTGLKVSDKKKEPELNKETQKEKKRLYREALLHVHPDKFSMEGDKVDLATDLSTQLIEIYQTGSLLELQEFHSHLFKVNSLDLDLIKAPKTKVPQDAYLQKEKAKLLQQLKDLKDKHTYKVLIDYKDPITFVGELKTYYSDKLFKLRKRTRKG